MDIQERRYNYKNLPLPSGRKLQLMRHNKLLNHYALCLIKSLLCLISLITYVFIIFLLSYCVVPFLFKKSS